MPIIKGEKYACTSCIKGHRVSGCTHSDRELHHINPKGRPVKQCEHCRGARKSKSHHARCECGDKKDKDKPKDKGDSKGEKLGGDASSQSPSSDECCCHDGGKCICGLKKDASKAESNAKHTMHAKAKPRLTSTHSESTLTVFANGHHKPCHRLNNTAHTSGAPYKIPRPHTHPGLPGHSPDGLESVYGKYNEISQRSLDNLGVSSSSPFYESLGSAQRSVDNLPTAMSLGPSLDLSELKFNPSMFLFNTSSDLQPASDQGSPTKSPSGGDIFLPAQWPWINTALPPQSSAFGPIEDYSTSPTADFLSTPENDWIIPSAGLNPLWSAGDLPLDPDKLASDLTQPISHSGESSRASAPALTTSSSGAQSEIGEPALCSDAEFKSQMNKEGQTMWEDTVQCRDSISSYRLSSMSLVTDHNLSSSSTSTPQMKSRHSFDVNLLKKSGQTQAWCQPDGTNINASGFGLEPLNDIVGSSKDLCVAPNFANISTPVDEATDFGTLIDSAGAISIPNTFETGRSDANTWLPLFGMSNTGADNLSAYNWLG